jgi:Uma2 family endonuclease
MQMAATVPSLLSVDDWLDLPADAPRSELIDGELFMAPPPDLYHQDIALNIATILRGYLRESPVGKVYVAPVALLLDQGTGLQPDVLFVSSGKVRQMASSKGIDVAPDLVVEILSPSTSKQDRGMKKDKYSAHGVLEYWIVDPKVRTIEIYYLQENSSRPACVRSEPESFSSSLFPGLTFSGKDIFAA